MWQDGIKLSNPHQLGDKIDTHIYIYICTPVYILLCICKHPVYVLRIISYMLYIAYWLPSDCPWNTYVQPWWIWARDPKQKGPRPKTTGPQAPDPAAVGAWSLVPAPYPLWLNMCASRAIDTQSMTDE